MSKGHTQRPTDHEAFAEAFDRIFGKVRTLKESEDLDTSQEHAQETQESEQDDD